MQPPNIQPCPQCGSVATVKVSAVVAAGTNLNVGGPGIEAGIGLTGPTISVTSGSARLSAQSLVASQLALPTRGYRGQDARNLALGIGLLLGILLFVDFSPYLLGGVILAGLFAAVGEYRCGMEKADARLAWDELYYCQTNHLVYVGNFPEKWAPADRMKDYLVSPRLRREHLDSLGHLHR